jgi:hypothetical protein
MNRLQERVQELAQERVQEPVQEPVRRPLSRLCSRSALLSRSALRTGSLALVSLIALGVSTACSQNSTFVMGTEASTPVAEQGTLTIAMRTNVGGISYLLSGATFQITGVESLSLSGDTASDVVLMRQQLTAGDYAIRLEPGWLLEREGQFGFQPIEANLTSANPQAFTITPGGATPVAYSFETEAGTIRFGEGSLTLDIEVSQVGLCEQGGVLLSVSDGNPCTAERCNANGVVEHTPLADGTECDDNNACTASDRCTRGVCGGQALPLPELDECGRAVCEPATGSILREAIDGCDGVIASVVLSAPVRPVVDCDTQFQDPGAVFFGEGDGRVSVLSSNVNVGQPGTYTVTYGATASNGDAVSAVRTVDVCGARCGTRGAQFLDYGCGLNAATAPCAGGWTPQALTPALDTYSKPEWRWNPRSNPLDAFINLIGDSTTAPITMLRSSFNAQDRVIEGTLYAPEQVAKGPFGLIFGYQNAGDFYLFDWWNEENGNTGSPPGMAIKRVNAGLAAAGALGAEDFTGRKSSGPVQVLEQGGRRLANDLSWPAGTSLPFSLEVHARGVRLIVRGGTGEVLADWVVRGENLGGPIGYYSYFAPATAFRGVRVRWLPASCASFPLN